jgi:hypothetical protein
MDTYASRALAAACSRRLSCPFDALLTISKKSGSPYMTVVTWDKDSNKFIMQRSPSCRKDGGGIFSAARVRV